MSSIRNQTEVVEFLAPRIYRVTSPIAAACGMISAAGSAAQLLSGDLGVRIWVTLLTGLYVAGFSGWFAINLWRNPAVRITPREVELGQLGSSTRRRVLLSELVGLRWQDSFDLRLCARSGTEYSIHLSQVARSDRQRLEDVLRERIGSDSLVI